PPRPAHACSRRPPCRRAPSWPARTPAPLESRSPPASPAGGTAGLSCAERPRPLPRPRPHLRREVAEQRVLHEPRQRRLEQLEHIGVRQQLLLGLRHPRRKGRPRREDPAMLLFCPACGNVLVAEEGPRCHRFACTTCPYVRNVTRKVSSRKYPRLKEVDDVLGGAAAWENVDSTAEPCPKCEHPRAYFMQIQTRSADEPMTTFYKCCNAQCGHRWRD
uniref:DNA-directed RNA polymerase III subunit RPC10 n=4 Tax=Phasianidae TaxID=9005 RepID=A0A8V0Z8M8_CHICK